MFVVITGAGAATLACQKTLFDRFERMIQGRAVVLLGSLIADASPGLLASFIRGTWKNLANARDMMTAMAALPSPRCDQEALLRAPIEPIEQDHFPSGKVGFEGASVFSPVRTAGEATEPRRRRAARLEA